MKPYVKLNLDSDAAGSVRPRAITRMDGRPNRYGRRFVLRGGSA